MPNEAFCGWVDMSLLVEETLLSELEDWKREAVEGEATGGGKGGRCAAIRTERRLVIDV